MNGKIWVVLVVSLLLICVLAACARPETKEISMILIAHDGANEWSIEDRLGIEQTLNEIGLQIYSKSSR